MFLSLARTSQIPLGVANHIIRISAAILVSRPPYEELHIGRGAGPTQSLAARLQCVEIAAVDSVSRRSDKTLLQACGCLRGKKLCV